MCNYLLRSYSATRTCLRVLSQLWTTYTVVQRPCVPFLARWHFSAFSINTPNIVWRAGYRKNHPLFTSFFLQHGHKDKGFLPQLQLTKNNSCVVSPLQTQRHAPITADDCERRRRKSVKTRVWSSFDFMVWRVQITLDYGFWSNSLEMTILLFRQRTDVGFSEMLEFTSLIAS